MSEETPWWEDIDVDVSEDARRIIEERLGEAETPEEAHEEIEEIKDESGEEVDEEVSDEIDEAEEEQDSGELSDEAEYYNSFSSWEEAQAFASQYPGVFVIVYDDELDEYEVYRDYGNEAAAA